MVVNVYVQVSIYLYKSNKLYIHLSFSPWGFRSHLCMCETSHRVVCFGLTFCDSSYMYLKGIARSFSLHIWQSLRSLLYTFVSSPKKRSGGY